MRQSQTKQVSGELERLLLELRRELVEEEGETAVDIVHLLYLQPLQVVTQHDTPGNTTAVSNQYNGFKYRRIDTRPAGHSLPGSVEPLKLHA